jgi:hypothetical protein
MQPALARRHNAPVNLVLLYRLEKCFEVAFTEPVIAFALDKLKEDRADHGFREYLQQDARFATIHHTLPINQDAVAGQSINRL